MKQISLIILLLAGVWQLTAQTTVLTQFSGFQQSTAVQLSFTISGGNTCQGTEIERSPDSIHFTTIGSIAGICGSNEKDETYTFIDTAPVENQKNYYRILLGQLGYSPVIGIPFFSFEQGIVLMPNPAMENTTLYFPNESKELLELNLYDASGRLTFTAATRLSSYVLETSHYPGGIYLMVIRQEGISLYKSRLMIQ